MLCLCLNDEYQAITQIWLGFFLRVIKFTTDGEIHSFITKNIYIFHEPTLETHEIILC